MGFMEVVLLLGGAWVGAAFTAAAAIAWLARRERRRRPRVVRRVDDETFRFVRPLERPRKLSKPHREPTNRPGRVAR